ncbi:uncharacterized protein RHO25_001563 [Cercospora beticola]|uniref:Uncharacterized protein n=1 Tax=Cercospora beticola TaxID=122368 RepID=A0ABZ0NBR2_CERBT|nr:hypothetical protein RHO25_001563 [Cercospora beticola]
MAKEKTKGSKGAHNKHLSARAAFLLRASTYLASQQAGEQSSEHLPSTTNTTSLDEPATTTACTTNSASASSQQVSFGGLPFLLTAQLKQVALRSQTRLDAETKRAICKVCGAVLLEGQTCTVFVENTSRGGRKQRADVTVIACCACGSKKRIPTGVKRQQRKNQRNCIQQRVPAEATSPSPQHVPRVVGPKPQMGINAAAT